MKYKKAQDVLPKEIIELIQEYTDGHYIYIPRKTENHKTWGEISGIKYNLKLRNSEIYEKYLSGISVTELSQIYYLSEQSIRRILTKEKQRCS